MLPHAPALPAGRQARRTVNGGNGYFDGLLPGRSVYQVSRQGPQRPHIRTALRINDSWMAAVSRSMGLVLLAAGEAAERAADAAFAVHQRPGTIGTAGALELNRFAHGAASLLARVFGRQPP